MSAKLFVPIAALVLALGLAAGCGHTPSPGSAATDTAVPVAPTTPVSTNKADYPVFPDADAGADPSVPAEMGGKGFDGKGWLTNTDFDFIGDPHALKGGAYHDWIPDFPGTLRLFGPEANTTLTSDITNLVYETLLGVHPTTLEYVPGLATHWQISPDKMTYRYRINPNATFSDGTPVTSNDVVASWNLMVDKTLQDPLQTLVFGKLNRPVAISKYIVEVKAHDLNWRNFLYFSASMPILPSHILKDLNGDKYIKEYNYKLLPGTGPYTVEEQDIHKGQSITVRRRKDYWGEKARGNVGLNNFDELNFVVVRDENLALEMFKKGELDAYEVRRPRQWAEEMNFDNVQRGLVQKRKVFNDNPQGIQGFALNTRRPPLDDLRVRKALALLMDRPEIIQKIEYNEAVPLNSYFPASPYENPNDPKNDYDPQAALNLLAQAGWNSHDSQGRLVKNGTPLELELLYRAKEEEPVLTVYQEDLRKIGITLNLRLLTFETEVSLLDQRNFQMASIRFTGLLYPNPESEWLSPLADQKNNNNFTGFKNTRVDQICAAYDKMFDVQQRINAMREIDGILTNDYQWVLSWYQPATHLAYWDKFGMPQGILLRTGDYATLMTTAWIDPAKYVALQKALHNSSVKLDVGQIEDHYWDEYGKTHPFAVQ